MGGVGVMETRTPEELAAAGITIRVDERGKRHITMRADPIIQLRDGRPRWITCSSLPRWVPRRITRMRVWPVVALVWLYGLVMAFAAAYLGAPWRGCRMVKLVWASGPIKWAPPVGGRTRWTCPMCRGGLKAVVQRG